MTDEAGTPSTGPSKLQETDVYQAVIKKAKSVLEGLGQSVRPLLVKSGKRYRSGGCAVLLRLGDAVVFCTAGHVFDVGPGESVWAQMPDHSTVLISERADFYRTNPTKPDADRVDIGLVRLGARGREEVSSCPAVNVDALDLLASNANTQRLFVVVGYPTSKVKLYMSQRRAKFDGIGIVARSSTSSTKTSAGFGNAVHLVLHHDPDDSVDRHGHRTPRLEGMSGGAIFTLSDGAAGSTKPRLAAITTEWHRGHNAIVGTRMEVAIELARSVWPENVTLPRSRRIDVANGKLIIHA